MQMVRLPEPTKNRGERIRYPAKSDIYIVYYASHVDCRCLAYSKQPNFRSRLSTHILANQSEPVNPFLALSANVVHRYMTRYGQTFRLHSTCFDNDLRTTRRPRWEILTLLSKRISRLAAAPCNRTCRNFFDRPVMSLICKFLFTFQCECSCCHFEWVMFLFMDARCIIFGLT